MNVCMIVNETRVGEAIVCDPFASQSRYCVTVDDQRHGIIAHRLSVTTKFPGGRPFILYGLRALVRPGAWRQSGYTVSVDCDMAQRLSVIIKHGGGSQFVLLNLRATVNTQRQREVSNG